MPSDPTAEPLPMAVRKVTAEPILSLRAPGFTTSRPHIINAEIMDPHALHAMEQAWQHRTFPDHEIHVFHIQNVYITDECLIFDKNMQFIDNASDVHSDTQIRAAATDIITLNEQKRLPHFRQGIVTKRRAAGNYGHFLMEMLPMAVIGRSVKPDWDPHYWAHLADPPMLDVMLRAFRLLDIPLDRVLLKSYREPVFFSNLLVVRGLTKHGQYMSPNVVGVAETLAASIPAGTQRKLFVRRIPGWHGARALTNQDELCNRLAARGYDIIEPGSMSLEQQISAFRGADQVVGVSGAALTNIVFCKPGITVTSLIGSRVPDTFFWFIAAHKRLNYVEIRCEQERMEGPDAWKADFTISDADIRYLEDLTPNSPLPGAQTNTLAMRLATTEVFCHVQDVGDLTVRCGELLIGKASHQAIEGFGINPGDDIPPEEIEYRGILGRNWPSPWVSGGEFCGTKGWSLPLFGFAVRLRGKTEQRYRCRYDASFADGTVLSSVTAGIDCVAEPLAPLVSMTLYLERRDCNV